MVRGESLCIIPPGRKDVKKFDVQELPQIILSGQFIISFDSEIPPAFFQEIFFFAQAR